MPADWPTVPLGEVLTHRKEFVLIDDATAYKRCRVQLHAQGVLLRDVVPGADIKTKRQQVCRAGEFLVAEIDAKHGGFGLVPDDLAGAVVSSHYFLYGVREDKLDRRFLDYFIRTPAFREQVEAQGSTNYAAIRPADVLAYRMPLPPVAEQRRIVGRVDAIAGRLAVARRLRAEADAEASALMKAATLQFTGDGPAGNWVPLSNYVEWIENGWSPVCQTRPAQGNEWGVLKVGAVTYGRFDPTQNKALTPGTVPIPEYEVQPGDFLMSRANTTALAGACAVVGDTPSRLMLSDKHFRFVFRPEVPISRRYLDLMLKKP